MNEISKKMAENLKILLVLSLTVLITSCQNEDKKRGNFALCTTNKGCFIIEDSAEISQLNALSNRRTWISMCFEVTSVDIYYCLNAKIIKHSRIDSCSGCDGLYSQIINFVQKGKHINLYEVKTDFELYNKLTNLAKDNFIELEPKENQSKVLLWFHALDTLRFGLIEKETRHKMMRQLIKHKDFYIPKVARGLIDHLKLNFPLCYDAYYVPFGRINESNGDIILDYARVEANFAAGFPCEQLKNDAVANYVDSIQCVMPDTFKLSYFDNPAKAKMKELELKADKGFYGMVFQKF